MIMNRRLLLQTAAALAAASTVPQAFAQGTPPAAPKGTDALLFQDDPQFWYETVRLFGGAEYGGALFGEVIAIAQKIKSGDYDSWYDANNAFADRIAAEGEAQLKKGHRVSARQLPAGIQLLPLLRVLPARQPGRSAGEARL